MARSSNAKAAAGSGNARGASPRSMTGFGEARAEGKGFVVEVEIRSVNHRFLATHLRVPPDLALREHEVEERVRRALQRGSVTVAVQLRRLAGAAPGAVVDLEQARAVLADLRRLAKDLKLPGKITLEHVVRAPGIFVPRAGSAVPDPALQALALQAIERALAQLEDSREREGRSLAIDLRARVAAMRAAAAGIALRAPKAVEESVARMHRRVEELLGGERAALRPDDVAREIALLAERTDVAEELARLETHLVEVDALLGRREPVGRRLEFLVQECLREVNTIGSKSSDAEITKAVLDLKGEIERIREQAANLE